MYGNFPTTRNFNYDDYGIEDEIKRDISCNLGSLNIVNVMESGKFKRFSSLWYGRINCCE